MAHQSRTFCFTVGSHIIFPHIIQDRLQNILVLRYAQGAIGIRYNIVCPARIEPGDKVPILVVTHRILRLVTIMPWLFHANDRLHHGIDLLCRKTTDAQQMIPHFILFIDKLSLIAHGLNLAAATLSVKPAFRLHTKRRRRHHLLYSRITIILLALGNPRFHRITDDRIFHKQGIPVALTDSFAVVSDIFYRHSNDVVFLIPYTFHIPSLHFCPALARLCFRPASFQSRPPHIRLKQPVKPKPACLLRALQKFRECLHLRVRIVRKSQRNRLHDRRLLGRAKLELSMV